MWDSHVKLLLAVDVSQQDSMVEDLIQTSLKANMTARCRVPG